MQAGIKLQEESAIDSEVDSTHPLHIRARGTNMPFRNAEMITKQPRARSLWETGGRWDGRRYVHDTPVSCYVTFPNRGRVWFLF